MRWVPVEVNAAPALLNIRICPPAGDAVILLQVLHHRAQVVAKAVLPVRFVGFLGHGVILQEITFSYGHRPIFPSLSEWGRGYCLWGLMNIPLAAAQPDRPHDE